ncbi:hypothetical protein ABK040_008757 [Willaertia magna]
MDVLVDDYDFELKLLIVGDSGVGKSAFLTQKVENKFSCESKVTLGVDFKVEFIQLQDKLIKLQYWDTCGLERFKSFLSAYYRGCHGILLMFDVTDASSFLSIESWIVSIRKVIDNIPILLIGNKCDLDYLRRIYKRDVLKLTKKLNLSYLDYAEVSAKENIGVHEAVDKLTQLILERNSSNYNGIIYKMDSSTNVIRLNSLNSSEYFNSNDEIEDRNDRRNKCYK